MRFLASKIAQNAIFQQMVIFAKFCTHFREINFAKLFFAFREISRNSPLYLDYKPFTYESQNQESKQFSDKDFNSKLYFVNYF